MKNNVTKVIQKLDKITSFGGINFVHKEFEKSELKRLIDKELGSRTMYGAGYQYGELFQTWTDLIMSGGEVAEDIQQHFRSTLTQIPNNKVASADTLLRCLRDLSVENTVVTSTSDNNYNFNINEKLNVLNIKALLKLGLLQENTGYTLDYDNQILQHEKWDAKRTYKHTTGYFAGIASIGDHPVYIENRDGNANVKIDQHETLKRLFVVLALLNIQIDKFRADAGSYSKEIIDAVSESCNKFYIRANKCASLELEIRNITDWKSVEINHKKYEVASIKFNQFFGERNYRLVVMREPNPDKNAQPSLFTNDNMVYRCILTNDWDMSEVEVIEFYNQRGGAEKVFDVMNNDFGWKRLPCSDMAYNTVYLIITAIIKNFYTYFVNKVSPLFKNILPSTRLKAFIFRFICVAGKWIKKGRQQFLVLYTYRPYHKLGII